MLGNMVQLASPYSRMFIIFEDVPMDLSECWSTRFMG